MERRALSDGATLEILPDASSAAQAAASFVAREATRAIAERGMFSVALSGGSTPRPMFELLAHEELPWERVQLFQVDERVVPLDHPDSNARQLREALLERVPVPERNLHMMPVDESDPAARYAATLRSLLGEPAVLDMVHLGLGDDGHTASLVPGDLALEIDDADVAAVPPYRGHARISLTLPMLNRARRVLWLVSGSGKQRALAKLLARDPSVPASLVSRERALIVADRASAGGLGWR